jgi:hypothetical protein
MTRKLLAVPAELEPLAERTLRERRRLSSIALLDGLHQRLVLVTETGSFGLEHLSLRCPRMRAR